VPTNLIFVTVIILIALVFDFTNGFHDAANSICTVVSTRILTPRQAVLWAAFFNFIAFLIFGTAVAATIGKGLIDIRYVDSTVIFAGLIGTVIWNLMTWFFGLPTSSSHALIGGYAGAAIAKVGMKVIIASGWVKTIAFIFIAPAIGFFLGMILITAFSWFIQKKSPASVNRWARPLQVFSAALYSLGHGGNDAQKTMGIITGLLVATGFLHSFAVPLWVVLCCHSAIAFGTLFGGWRIVKTMGSKITKLNTVDGVSAEIAGASTLFLATHFGIPISTTHVITGAISGVGAAKRMSAVKWGITLRIVWAWFLTIPLSASFAFLVYLLIKILHL
jgi:inorganic phosphate transporter, PiT family